MNDCKPAYVYAFYDGDIPIYIGASVTPERRKAAHRRDSAWWTPELAFKIISEHPNHLTACFVEHELIREQQPTANLQGNPRYGRAAEQTRWGWLRDEAS